MDKNILTRIHPLLSYTFNRSGLEEATDGAFHTCFLPWFFYITESDNMICQSDYTKSLHTQAYAEDADGDLAGMIMRLFSPMSRAMIIPPIPMGTLMRMATGLLSLSPWVRIWS